MYHEYWMPNKLGFVFVVGMCFCGCCRACSQGRLWLRIWVILGLENLALKRQQGLA